MNARLAVAFVLALALAGAARAEAPPPQELVVLVHGLGRSERAMRPLAKRLEAAGYEVVALRYESTEKPVSHTAILRSGVVADQTVEFLRTGHFQREPVP